MKSTASVQATASRVKGVVSYEMPYIHDARGNLTVGEFGRPLPFLPKRYFITFDIPSEATRGEHAHKECHQYLICIRGRCTVMVDDGLEQEEFVLERPTQGIYVPPMVWAAEYGHSSDSTLMVFASDFYDPEDYIRVYDDFLRLKHG